MTLDNRTLESRPHKFSYADMYELSCQNLKSSRSKGKKALAKNQFLSSKNQKLMGTQLQSEVLPTIMYEKIQENFLSSDYVTQLPMGMTMCLISIVNFLLLLSKAMKNLKKAEREGRIARVFHFLPHTPKQEEILLRQNSFEVH